MAELNGTTLLAKRDELVEMMRVIRQQTTEPKVNVAALVESFDEDERATFDKVMVLVNKLDKLVHANYLVNVAQAINVEVSRLASDSGFHTKYLVSADDKARKIELDGAMVDLVRDAQKLKKNIESGVAYMEACDEEIPAAMFKRDDDGKFIVTKAGNKVLDLPRIFAVDEDEGTASKAGRPATASTLILGTVEDNGEVLWHDYPHIGTAFRNLYGSVRTDHNQYNLFKLVEKSDQSPTKGWETPVEYAGRKWVGKLRK